MCGMVIPVTILLRFLLPLRKVFGLLECPLRGAYMLGLHRPAAPAP